MLRRLVRRPFDDELTSSAWVRTSRRIGLPVATVTKAILGRKWYPGFFQGGHLMETAECTNTTAESLLDNHTVFPYATAFYSAAASRAARVSALSTGTSARAIGAVTQSASDFVPRKRWCPHCARDDLEAWGESYWRRSHNLPGVLVCLAHAEPLRESELATCGPGTWSVLLPHECGKGQALALRPTAFLTEVARQSLELLRQEPRDGSTAWYRRELYRLGLVTPAREVNVVRLIDWVKGIADRDLPLLGFRQDLELAWLPLMVRPSVDVPFIPLKHAVLRAALNLGSERAGRVLDHVPPGLRPHVHLQDAKFAEQLRELAKRRLLIGERVGVTEALSEIGCWESYRHARDRFPLVVRELKRLQRSGLSLRRVKRS